MPDDREEIDREIQVLENELKQLEAEYNMFFAGRLPRPPWETRSRVETLAKRLDRRHIANYGQRFRFTTLQTRIARFVDLWDRGLRAREEGRSGPFPAPRPSQPGVEQPGVDARGGRGTRVTTFTDPSQEADKLRDLYDRLSDARRAAGQEAIPFNKFADLVSKQAAALREQGSSGVTFRVAVKDGKVAFTAKPVKGTGAAGKKRKGKSGEADGEG